MKLQVYCVADSAVEAYMPPFYARARGEAIRSFTELVNNKDTTVGKYPGQFVLVFLGEFDDKEGKFYCGDPQNVIEALECVAEQPFSAETEVRRHWENGKTRSAM